MGLTTTFSFWSPSAVAQALSLLIWATVPPVWANGPGSDMHHPDFTKGDTIPEGASHDWNLGPTGARGWMYSNKLVTSDARQISVTAVVPGSPADGLLQIGDVILGVGDRPFSVDPREELGWAINHAESLAGAGVLQLQRWRAGQVQLVNLSLPVLGTYSSTAPYDCEKSRRILEVGCARLATRMQDGHADDHEIVRSLNGLALLASGNTAYLPVVRREALALSQYSARSFQTWSYSYILMFLSEYIMSTGDLSVFDELRRLAVASAEGQSVVGSWGHSFVQSDGRLGGYGMINSAGIPLTIGLVLAQKAGVDDPIVSRAVERSTQLLGFYAGKGAVPYGDHRPWIECHEDNGKCGMAAVLFDLLDDRPRSSFFSRMSLASHGSERDTGHTGNFFNFLWAMPGIQPSGPHATGVWMETFGSWSFDLARSWDGSFCHQGPPEKVPDSYDGWDASGAFLLAYAMPLANLCLTGRVVAETDHMSPEAALSTVQAGEGWNNKNRYEGYDQFSPEDLFGRLTSWSPVVRERAAMALGRRGASSTMSLIQMLRGSDLHSKYGACQALKHQGDRAAEAVPDLMRTLRAEDLWLRILAAEALAGIGAPAKRAVPMMLTQLARRDKTSDPRGMEQRYFSFALFDQRSGLIGRSIEGVNRAQLRRAIEAGLQNDDGRARGAVGGVFRHLTLSELKPLLPVILDAIKNPAPSGIMFAHEVRMRGLELLVKHRVSQGIELLAEYALVQKKHASEHRIKEVVGLLLEYGTHAQRVVGDLEAAAQAFDAGEENFPRHLSQQKAAILREAITDINASTDTPRLVRLPGLGG